MFERYDEHARRTIFFARFEASQSGSREISSLHLLLALIRENKSLFKQAVPGLSVDALVAECKKAIPVSSKIATNVDIPMTYESKRALAAAAEQAELTHSRVIRPLHLTIGLMTTSKEVKALFSAHGFTTEMLGANLDAGDEIPMRSTPHSPFIEFICQGESVASSPMHFFNPVPRAGDEVYLTRNN